MISQLTAVGGERFGLRQDCVRLHSPLQLQNSPRIMVMAIYR